MRAVGITGFLVNGAEANAIDLIDLDLEAGRVRWTVAPANRGGTETAGATVESDDPAVVEFVRRILSQRTLPDQGRPTSGSGSAASPPAPG